MQREWNFENWRTWGVPGDDWWVYNYSISPKNVGTEKTYSNERHTTYFHKLILFPSPPLKLGSGCRLHFIAIIYVLPAACRAVHYWSTTACEIPPTAMGKTTNKDRSLERVEWVRECRTGWDERPGGVTSSEKGWHLVRRWLLLVLDAISSNSIWHIPFLSYDYAS